MSGFLDFDFHGFAKPLKGLPEIYKLFRQFQKRSAGAYASPSSNMLFDFSMFKQFIRKKTKSIFYLIDILPSNR